MSDPFRLSRFVEAQDRGGVRLAALDELRRGRKTSHWIWFVLPQLAGLGHSARAVEYGITGLDEARAYLAHPLLGPRLLECVDVLLSLGGTSAQDVLGPVDAAKVRSSMTLFARADPDEPRFAAVLAHWYGGEEDPHTLALL